MGKGGLARETSYLSLFWAIEALSGLRVSSISLKTAACLAEEGRLQAASDQNIGVRLAEDERAFMLPAGHLKSDV